MARNKNQSKANGHAGPHDRANGSASHSPADPKANPHGVNSGDPYRASSSDPHRVNGHAPASLERGGISMPAIAGRHGDHAASDDGSGATAAIAASNSLSATTVRETYAEVAPPCTNGAENRSGEKTGSDTSSGQDKDDKIPPGAGPLPGSPADFVEEIHSRIDLFEVWQSLLKSGDHKIRQRAVEKLTEMRYKGVAALADESQQVEMDIDSAVARRAAEGATK